MKIEHNLSQVCSFFPYPILFNQVNGIEEERTITLTKMLDKFFNIVFANTNYVSNNSIVHTQAE